MMFLDRKDPVVDIKELLYERVKYLNGLVAMNSKIEPDNTHEDGMVDGETNQAIDELAFIINLLDTIERS